MPYPIQSTVAMSRLKRTEVIIPEKLKRQTFEWKTGLADIMSTNHHHLWKEENFKCAEWEESKKFEHHFVQFIPSTKMQKLNKEKVPKNRLDR